MEIKVTQIKEDPKQLVGKTIMGISGGDGEDYLAISFTDDTIATFAGCGEWGRETVSIEYDCDEILCDIIHNHERLYDLGYISRDTYDKLQKQADDEREARRRFNKQWEEAREKKELERLKAKYGE